jgi:hypothetical protein
MGESTQDMRSIGRRSRDWRFITQTRLVAVVLPTMVVMTAALAVSAILAPPIRAFAPPVPTEPPKTSTHPDGSQQQKNRKSFHLKPYLSIRASSRVGGGLDVGQT